MEGYAYANRIALYIKQQYSERGVKIYREISIGKTIIGKNRRLDILLVNEIKNLAFAIECKYQEVHGTVDEKIPYTINDLESMQMNGCVTYAGTGFSQGVLHMLEAHPRAVFCLPDDFLARSSQTKELDDVLAMHFGWWDVLVTGKIPM
jgi:hypothetical protein